MLQPPRGHLRRLFGLILLLFLTNGGEESAHNRACADDKSAQVIGSPNVDAALAATPVRLLVDASTPQHPAPLVVLAGSATHAEAAPAPRIGTLRSCEPSRGEGARPPPSLA